MNLGYESLKSRVAPEGYESRIPWYLNGAGVPDTDGLFKQPKGIVCICPPRIPTRGILGFTCPVRADPGFAKSGPSQGILSGSTCSQN